MELSKNQMLITHANKASAQVPVEAMVIRS